VSYFKVIGIFLATVAVLAVSIIGFGCANNTESTSAAPEFEEPGPPPIEITVDQVYADYVANEEDADVKYSEKILLFSGIEVEEVVGNYFFMSEYMGAADLVFVKLYFTSGSAKFKLRDEYFGIMQNIEEGYVLNVVGECEGLQEGFIIIDDCWVESVIGDLGTDADEDSY